MLALLHFHTIRYTPVQLAYLFVLYEAMSIITKLMAGWIGARFGKRMTLLFRLGLQIVSLPALAQLDPTWVISGSAVYVMVL